MRVDLGIGWILIDASSRTPDSKGIGSDRESASSFISRRWVEWELPKDRRPAAENWQVVDIRAVWNDWLCGKRSGGSSYLGTFRAAWQLSLVIVQMGAGTPVYSAPVSRSKWGKYAPKRAPSISTNMLVPDMPQQLNKNTKKSICPPDKSSELPAFFCYLSIFWIIRPRGLLPALLAGPDWRCHSHFGLSRCPT